MYLSDCPASESRSGTATSCCPTAGEFDNDTIIWTAGVKASPVVAESDLPTDAKRGQLKATATLQVVGHPDVDGGDVAAVPDLSRTGRTPGDVPPNAQHAVRQARHLARTSFGRSRRQRRPTTTTRTSVQVAGLGLHKGVSPAL